MITIRITTEIKDDRRVVLTLPPEVPTGPVDLVVRVDAVAPEVKQPRTSLADWADDDTVVVIVHEVPEKGSLREKLLRLAGTVDDLPADMARNHLHYIHGIPKR